MLEKEQWPPSNFPDLNAMDRDYRVWGATHEAILKASSKAQNSFRSCTGEDMRQFSAGTTYK